MADKEMIQEKIGEALGLEKAAQKVCRAIRFTGPPEIRAYDKVIKNERGSRYPRAGDGRTS